MATQTLHGWLDESARNHPMRVAVEDTDGATIAYPELANLSDRLRDRLSAMGVQPGDRVGICLTKSIDAVASIFGILKTGAAYVPTDPNAPASRNAYILNNCRVKAAIVEERFAKAFVAEFEKLGPAPALLIVDATGGGTPLAKALDDAQAADPAPSIETVATAADDLAYILYTSGSTGWPKGVMLTHENATSYVDWCSEVFQPTAEDRFSSHAPFHFDLSILDIYVPLKHGASLVLVSSELGKEPARLAQFISERRLTVWYSTPSILSLLSEYGNLPDYDYSALRFVLFAGEVFPVKYLRAIKQLIPHPRYFNLYGPTETNVCTYYEIPTTIPDDRTEPYPIGPVCSHLQARVVDEGTDVNRGTEGELCITGPAVTQGYWELPEQTEKAFLPERDGVKWYRTGDIVVEQPDGVFLFRGRRDRMVKKRGFRVELGEIEACLYRHPAIRQAAVIALSDDEGIRVKAFVSTKPDQRVSIIGLKSHCSTKLPLYMVPDLISIQDSLPTTSTDKIDYQALAALQ